MADEGKEYFIFRLPVNFTNAVLMKGDVPKSD